MPSRFKCAATRLLLLTSLLLGGTVSASPLPLHPGHTPLAWMSEQEAQTFPRYDALEPAVGFWIRVFSEFSEDQSVVHSAIHPEVVLEILDFSTMKRGMKADTLARQRRKAEHEAKQRGEALLRKIHAKRHKPASLTADERRIFERFAHIKDDQRFVQSAGQLRTQRGLRERTRHALEVAGHYLPDMERVFAQHGLPRLLTRLPVLESSFNVDAYSKVGAAGLWQFMPASARMYMRYDEIVDQRRDPWTSTDGAARHLLDDHKMLGSWPLALTAYNHGRGGIARGLKKTGGRTIVDLVNSYESRSFGFASRNFYAEFLAVLEIDHHRDLYFGPIAPRKIIAFDTVRTGDYVEYRTLQKLSGADAAQFRQLNPAFSSEVVGNKILVPPDFTIRVPPGKAARFTAAYAKLDGKHKHASQRHYFVTHRVRKGETIGRIARHYGVTQRDIISANALRNPHRIRIGQRLKVPPRGQAAKPKSGRVTTALKPNTADVMSAPSTAAVHRIHRVRQGQTLWQLARLYQTTVTEIREINNLRDSSILRTGMRLKIPPKVSNGASLANQPCETACS